jgi:hypothetical protein
VVTRCLGGCEMAGIQPHQNIGSMAKITEGSGGSYDGKTYGRDMIIK